MSTNTNENIIIAATKMTVRANPPPIIPFTLTTFAKKKLVGPIVEIVLVVEVIIVRGLVVGAMVLVVEAILVSILVVGAM